MKAVSFLFILSILLLASCEKKIVERVDSAEFGYEEIEPAFSKTTFQMSTDISGHEGFRGCMWWGLMDFYSWTIDYRFGDGIESNGRAFYPIEKKWDVTFQRRYCCNGVEDSWTNGEEWFKHDRLYRYDTQNKKAMVYQGVDDDSPETIMDFDLEAGDYWVIDDEYELIFYIDEVSEFILNNVSYPVYKGHYAMRYKYFKVQNYESDQPVYISPFNPNPFKMVDDFKDFERKEWSIFQKNEDDIRPPQQWLPESNGTGHFDRYVRISHSFDSRVDIPVVPSSYLYY